jgi:hypothetical protein
MEQSTVLERVLRDHPEKQRVFFVHIPKCAGTDFSVHLQKLYPAALHQTLASPDWTPLEQLTRQLSAIEDAVKASPSILVHGHIRLRWVIENNLARPADRLITIVREPAQLLLSQVNYIAGSLMSDPRGTRTDTRQWLGRLGIGDVVGCSADHVAAMAAKLTHKNPMCHALGAGTAESALAAVRGSNITITDTDRYVHWGESTWGVPFTTRYNASRKIVDHVSPEAIEEGCSEDLVLYDAVMRAMSGGLEVRGSRV